MWKLGDVIWAATDALGIPHCSECEKRRRRLNDFGAKVGAKVSRRLSSRPIQAKFGQQNQDHQDKP